MILQENLTPSEAKIVVTEGEEDKSGNKKLYMEGIFIEGDVRNHNQRVYPLREIRRAVNDVMEIIDQGQSVLGELDHPEELQVNLDRVTHDIQKMWIEGNAGYGKLRILPTPSGNIVRTLLENNVKLGVSSRGSGNVNDRGEVTDFQITTVDIVLRPSAPRAYPKAIYETRNAKRGAIIEDLSKAVSHDPRAKKYLYNELMTWISQLK